jgi:hypothetical protein
MPARDHLHPKLFHGTYNPDWQNNPDWIHAGSVEQAKERLRTGFYDWEVDKSKGKVHELELHKDATIYPKVIPAVQLPDEGEFWYDLGHRLTERNIDLTDKEYLHKSGKPYDVYPYENVEEGKIGDNTSYIVNPKMIKRTKEVK